MSLFPYKWFLCLLPVVLFPTLRQAQDKPFSKPHMHPFYVSVVEVNHNQKDATLEISCKLFAEDAQATLEQDYKTKIDFEQPQQKATLDGLLKTYVQQHLSLVVNKKAALLRYVGFEKEAESLYCYFEIDGVASLQTLDLTNSLLYDFSDKQINIMHVMAGGTRKSYKLDYPDTKVGFSF